MVQKIADDAKLTLAELVSNKNIETTIQWENYVSNDFDKLTLEDIKSELATVGRFTRRAKQKKDVKKSLPFLLWKDRIIETTQNGKFELPNI